MIKSVSLLTRKEGMTHEQFVRHWYDVHARSRGRWPGCGALFIGRIKTYTIEEKVIV